MSILHHQSLVKEYGEVQQNERSLFQAGGINLETRGTKKYIKIDTSKFGQYFPKDFRRVLESPSIREINELKNRVEDFNDENTKSNPLESIPVRLAFSIFPLVYSGSDKKISSLITSGNLTEQDVYENSDFFSIDVTINNNPDGFFGGLTPINAKIIDRPSDAYSILLKENINKILPANTQSVVWATNDYGLIVSDGKNENLIDGYQFTFDKQVAGVEMSKTTVREGSDLIIDDLDSWKKERFNLSINLKSLINYFNNYYSSSQKEFGGTELINHNLLLFEGNDIINIGEFFIENKKINTEIEFRKVIHQYKNINKEKYNQYIKFYKKLDFSNMPNIGIKAKDLLLTPPLTLWLEKLINKGISNNLVGTITGKTITDKHHEMEKLSIEYENILFDILGMSGESEFKYSFGKDKKFKVKTPDYIEKMDGSYINIYDFKVSQNFTAYDNYSNNNEVFIKYKGEHVNISNIFIICLDKKIASDNSNCIYFRDFLKNNKITSQQQAKLNSLEQDYIFSKSQFITSSKVQKIIQ